MRVWGYEGMRVRRGLQGYRTGLQVLISSWRSGGGCRVGQVAAERLLQGCRGEQVVEDHHKTTTIASMVSIVSRSSHCPC
jgi:hypothetical protein